MKKYSLNLLIRICCVIISTMLTGYLFSEEKIWGVILCCILTFYAVYQLYIFQKRTIKDVKHLIDAIHFSEFNVSFKGHENNALPNELIPQIEHSIQSFNKKLKKREIEQNFYNILLSRIDFGIIVINTKNEITWINQSALDLFGKPYPKDLSDLKTVSEELPSIFENLIPKETKIFKIKRNKNDIQLAATAIFFSVEKYDLKLISIKDIQSVLEENESEAWKKLIRVLTHEIMNSITPIISLAETFSDVDETDDPKLVNKAMQTIFRRSKGLVNFMHNYQRLTRIPNPILKEFQAIEMIEDINRLLKAEGLFFTYKINPSNIMLYADREQMEQVLINLIKNACEASYSKEKPEVKVNISLDEYQQIPIIKVSDNGEGILPEAIDKIFIPFFTTKTNGSGIGLSICRQIINLHGGTISVESIPDEKTEFTITLYKKS